jgi:putative DNA primase/helicase
VPDPTLPQTPEEIRAQVAERIREEEELLTAPSKTPSAPVITPDFIRDCLANNERGDGILYASTHRGKFVFIKSLQTWLKWSNHHWEIDKLDEHIRAVEQVALQYFEEAEKLATPIKRETEAVLAANKKVKQAEKDAKAAVNNGDDAALMKANSEGKAAEEEGLRHSGELKRLTDQKKAFQRRVERLRSLRGANNCTEWAHMVEQPLAIIGDEVDQQPLLLPCNNGVIDLRTGLLQPGRPDHWLIKAVPCDYLGFDYVSPDWEHGFLPSIMPDEELRNFIQILMGYSITGLRIEQFIAWFTGLGGNGKGVFFNSILDTIGELGWRIQPELILEQKTTRSSSGASPDIVALQGRRLVVASETGEHRKISAEKVKELTGSDTLNGRLLYDKFETNFKPTHKLFGQSQYIPKGLAKDHALRRRLILIEFPFLFVDDPAAEARRYPQNAERYRAAEKGLEERLLKDRPGILSWLVRGCAMWLKQGGLKPPDKIRADVEALRMSEDHLGQFLSGCCLCDWEPDRLYSQGDHVNYQDFDYHSTCDDNRGRNPTEFPQDWYRCGPGLYDDQWIYFKEFYGAFKKWYAENISEGERYLPSNKAIADQLRAKGVQFETKGGQLRVFKVKVLVSE